MEIFSDDSDIFVEFVSKPTPSLPKKTPAQRNSSTSVKPSPQQSKPSPKCRKNSKATSSDSPQKSILDFFKATRKQDQPKISVRKDLLPVNNQSSDKSRSTEVRRTMKRFKTIPEKAQVLQDESDVEIPVVLHSTPPKTPTHVTLSPGVKKRMNRFKSITPEKPPARKKLVLDVNDDDSVEVIPIVPYLDPLNFMIQEVRRNQALVKRTTNQCIEPLFSREEELIIQSYLFLNPKAQSLFVRRFFGKENWHRVADDTNYVKELSEKDLILTSVGDMPLPNLLHLLSKDELTKIFKKYALRGNATRKKAMIEALLRNARTQKSVMDVFVSNSVSREVLIRREAIALLGPMYKVSPKSRETMNRLVLLFSVVHNIDDESKRAQSQRFFVGRILKGEIKFMAYEVIPVVLFQTRSDFIAYESALKLRIRLDEAFEKKLFENLEEIAGDAKTMFEHLLGDVEYILRIQTLPSFLMRFSAGSVLASVLTHYCERHKKKQNSETVIRILTMLLEQTYFGVRRRGKWYELLCQAHVSASHAEEAVNILTIAKLDKSLDDVKILTLQFKAQRLQKQKKFANVLDLWNADVWEEPASVEINGQAIDNVQGSKLVYVQKTATGVRYSSVEEHAIAYYKTQGFPHGAHTEGFIVSTIFYTLFFDIIYSKVPGAFLSQFQDRPLDFYSSSFFINRKDAFLQRLNEMITWTESTAAHVIENCFRDHHNTYCVISWSETVTWQTLADIVACMGISAVKAICERFIYQPSLARSGFPDLTLWNVATKKCKFVEVKSPKDTLAPNQRVWLSYLKNNGISCEVCNVRNVAAKSAPSADSFSPVE